EQREGADVERDMKPFPAGVEEPTSQILPLREGDRVHEVVDPGSVLADLLERGVERIVLRHIALIEARTRNLVGQLLDVVANPLPLISEDERGSRLREFL